MRLNEAGLTYLAFVSALAVPVGGSALERPPWGPRSAHPDLIWLNELSNRRGC